ncbi:MAG: M28 family peptidase [Planctomycetota bacterium]|nr:M28 family peptidase [Planctomycetota bacterium]
MKALTLSLCLSLAFLPALADADDTPTSLLGFAADRVAGELALERRYDSLLDADNLRRWMERMTVRPHHVGSAQARANAEFIAQEFRAWGYATEIEVFHVLFPTPTVRELEMLAPRRFKASLEEPALTQGPVAEAIRKEGLPPFNAYSADGDVVGELVYVHQGLPRDYEELERRGIDVKGKIVIARYGGSWRGIKPKVAAEHGAIGCLIYNDPEDDGYAQGGAYPGRAFKHEAAVQRGSVIDLPRRPGDPLTPGRGGTQDAKRLPREEAETLMTIPVLPISWSDARPLLESLGGEVVPAAWRGGLPITYRSGPGPARVRLRLKFSWDLVPAYNVIARMEGSERPDQWIIRGNHHDAWVVGARDPMSGMVALMEQARAFGELAKSGWRPRRTLVFCAWDAEEPGLLGSTDWVEHHADELRDKACVYINTDGNSRGFLRIGGSHSLERLAAEAAHAVTDPQTRVSVSERLRAVRLVRGSAEQKKEARSRDDLRLGALGSGSDYTAFLQHLGIASFNVAFTGEGRGGEYHTNFDTFDHFSRFIDPGFHYGVALAQVCGRLTLRLANADVLPFDFTGSAHAIGKYVDEVVELADSKRKETEETNRLVQDGRFRQAADPTKPFVEPRPEDPVPHLNFAPLENARTALERSATEYSEALRAFHAGGGSRSGRQLAEVDRVLYRSERALTNDQGLPRRPWFRHVIYAPGYYTGYGVKTLPGVREAIEERRWDEAEKQIAVAARAIEELASRIRRAAAGLRAGPAK